MIEAATVIPPTVHTEPTYDFKGAKFDLSLPRDREIIRFVLSQALFDLLENPDARAAQRAAMALTMQRLGRGGEAPGLRAARSVMAAITSAPRPR